jgi:hypothetical protein
MQFSGRGGRAGARDGPQARERSQGDCGGAKQAPTTDDHLISPVWLSPTLPAGGYAFVKRHLLPLLDHGQEVSRRFNR